MYLGRKGLLENVFAIKIVSLSPQPRLKRLPRSRHHRRIIQWVSEPVLESKLKLFLFIK